MPDPAGPLSAAVDCSVDALSLTPADEAAAALARQYALAIDADPDELGNLGPKLLAALTALGATPAARSRSRAVPAVEVDEDELTLRRLRGGDRAA